MQRDILVTGQQIRDFQLSSPVYRQIGHIMTTMLETYSIHLEVSHAMSRIHGQKTGLFCVRGQTSHHGQLAFGIPYSTDQRSESALHIVTLFI